MTHFSFSLKRETLFPFSSRKLGNLRKSFLSIPPLHLPGIVINSAHVISWPSLRQDTDRFNNRQAERDDGVSCRWTGDRCLSSMIMPVENVDHLNVMPTFFFFYKKFPYPQVKQILKTHVYKFPDETLARLH